MHDCDCDCDCVCGVCQYLRFGMFPGSGTLYGNDDELPYYWLMDAL